MPSSRIRRAPVARINTPRSSAVGGSTFLKRSSRSERDSSYALLLAYSSSASRRRRLVHHPGTLPTSSTSAGAGSGGRTSSRRSTSASAGNRRPQLTREQDRHHAAADDRGNRPDQEGGEPGLERAELIRGADEHHLDRVHPAPQPVGRWPARPSSSGCSCCRGRRTRSRASASNEITNTRERPNTTMLAPYRPTTISSVRPARRSIGWRVIHAAPSRAPTAGAARSTPSPVAPDVQDRAGEHRQQRDRPAEQHREQVQQDGAEQDLRPAHEPEPLEHALDARPAPRPRPRRPDRPLACGCIASTIPAETRHEPAASRYTSDGETP